MAMLWDVYHLLEMWGARKAQFTGCECLERRRAYALPFRSLFADLLFTMARDEMLQGNIVKLKQSSLRKTS